MISISKNFWQFLEKFFDRYPFISYFPNTISRSFDCVYWPNSGRTCTRTRKLIGDCSKYTIGAVFDIYLISCYTAGRPLTNRPEIAKLIWLDLDDVLIHWCITVNPSRRRVQIHAFSREINRSYERNALQLTFGLYFGLCRCNSSVSHVFITLYSFVLFSNI